MLCGDFNIDMNIDSVHARRLKNLCDDNGLKLFITELTRVTQSSATQIDLCLSNIPSNKLMCSVSIEDKISDH